jgi:trimethylamine--corrinoid protein Co-methyltransferase
MALRCQCERPLKIISDAQIREIHLGTLRVLEEVGVRFADEDTLAFLADHGCRVDHLSQVVKFPAGMVEDCLRACPTVFRLRARNPEYDILFDQSSVQFAACSGMEILDLETMERRAGTLADARRAVRLCDALENIAGANTGLGHVVDRPPEVNLEWLYATAIRNSEKVTSVGVMDDSERWGIKMAQAAGEDIIVVPSSSSPLGWSADQIRGMERALAAGMPVGAQSMASPGTTAPATLAGTAVVMNAEILAMAVLIQLLKPGTGVMYSCFTIPMDMRTTGLASGSMELAMLTVISAQLSKHYGLGSIVFLPMSDAKLLDEQAGFEKGMQWLLAGMSGINLIWGAGMVEGHGLWSNAQLVVDSEMCGMVGRYLKGVGLSGDTVALDVVEEVGHFPATYLDTDHTYDWWRGERYVPLVASREVYEVWAEMGEKDIVARAAEKAEALLREHQPVPLDEDVDRALDSLLRAAARDKGVASAAGAAGV